MKQKRKENRGERMIPGLIGTAVILAILIGATSIGMAGIETEEEMVSRLVCQRNDAMIGYFANELSFWDAKKILMETESGTLLEEDLDSLRAYFCTDIDEVRSYEIENVEIHYADEELICGVVDISWETLGLEGEDAFCVKYSVICQAEYQDEAQNPKMAENSQKTYKIVQFF